MADTGWKNPASTGETLNQWSNPTYAYADDTNYATESSINQGQDYYDFSFGIPYGATVNGIEARFLANSEDDFWDPQIDTVNLSWNGGSNWTTANGYTGTIADTGFTYYTIGSTSEDWGHTWDLEAADEMGNDNFRIRFYYDAAIGGDLIYLDELAIRVTYSGGARQVSTSDSVVVTDTATPPYFEMNINKSEQVFVADTVQVNNQQPDLNLDLGNIRGIKIVNP